MNPPPDKPFDGIPLQQAPGLSPMERMGVLMVRLIHDLSNQLTILAGNAQVLDMVRDNPERLARVIDRIKTSSTNAGNLIDRFARLRQDFRFRSAPYSVAACADEIVASNPLASGWRVERVGNLEGQVALEPPWVAYAVWQVALLCGAVTGNVKLSAGDFPVDWDSPAYAPSRLRERKSMRCELRWQGAGPWLDEKEAAKPSDLNLATVHEVAKIVEGWAHYRFISGEEHRFSLFLPLSL